MLTKRYESVLKADVGAVWSFHSSAEALNALTPGSRKMRFISSDLAVREGAVHEFRVKVGPLWVTWKAQLSAVDPPHGFVDSALKSPFKTWIHKHEFISHPAGTLIRDTIEYDVPFGILGALANRLFISKDIDRLFAFRHKATVMLLDGAKDICPTYESS